MTPHEVLDFWFLPPGAEGYGKPRFPHRNAILGRASGPGL